MKKLLTFLLLSCLTIGLFSQGATKRLWLKTGGNITFEGATEDSFQMIIDVVDPTGMNTATFQDATGTIAYLGDIGGGSVGGMGTVGNHSIWVTNCTTLGDSVIRELAGDVLFDDGVNDIWTIDYTTSPTCAITWTLGDVSGTPAIDNGVGSNTIPLKSSTNGDFGSSILTQTCCNIGSTDTDFFFGNGVTSSADLRFVACFQDGEFQFRFNNKNDTALILSSSVAFDHQFQFFKRLSGSRVIIDTANLSRDSRIQFSEAGTAAAKAFIKLELNGVLTDAANIAWDMAVKGNNASVTVADSRTLDNPTSILRGVVSLRITASAADRTTTFGTAYKFEAGATTHVTQSGETDLLLFFSDGTDLIIINISDNI